MLERTTIATRTRDEWMRAFREGGDFIFTQVNSVSDLPDDPQVRANGMIAAVQHPAHGMVEMLNLPIGLSETPPRIQGPAPEFGQHTEQVLVEELGWSWERVAALKERQVV